MEEFQAQAVQFFNNAQTYIQQTYATVQEFIMSNWKQYSAEGAAYFDTLMPGHGYDIVVALAVVLLTTLLIVLSVIPICLCGGRRRNRKSRAPVVLMVGIPGAGKTAATTRLVYGKMAETLTSQTENVVPDVDLGEDVHAMVVDSPGHQRVRSVWHNFVGRNAGAQAATHIVFMVNSVDARNEARHVAEFLFDILSDPEVQDEELPVLLLCTKSDMQTALPVQGIVPLLERQLQELRESSLKDAHDKRDIIARDVDESETFTFDKATLKCTFASASARTGDFAAIARFVREM